MRVDQPALDAYLRDPRKEMALVNAKRIDKK